MIYRFSDFSLNSEGFELKAGSDKIAVEPQVLSLLQLLIENRDRVVSKDELIDQVWDGRIVSDAALNSCVNAARRAVGDDGKTQAVIRTFPRRGFRFIADLVGEPDADGSPLADTNTAQGQAGRPAIAVLPFDNLSGDPEQEYFSDGITEDIISAISRLAQFLVIERNSTLGYKGQAVDVRTVAQELGVTFVVEGSVRKAGNRVRISAQLIDAENRNPIWVEKYDRELDDIFAIQDEITRNIVGCVEPELMGVEWKRARAKPLEDLGTWELYHRAMALIWDRQGFGKPDRVRAAMELLKQVVEQDPGFAPAHSGQAYCHYALAILGHSVDSAKEANEALAAGRRAIALDDGDYFAHLGLGVAHMAKRQIALAIERLRTAVDLNPSSSRAHYNLGQALVFGGHAAEAIQHLETSVQLNPRDVSAGPNLVRRAEAHYQLGEFDQAVDWATRALRSPITQFWGNAVLLAALAKLGRDEEASLALADLLERRPDITVTKVGEIYPVSDQAFLDDYLDGLRKGGLPG